MTMQENIFHFATTYIFMLWQYIHASLEYKFYIIYLYEIFTNFCFLDISLAKTPFSSLYFSATVNLVLIIFNLRLI